MIEKWYAVVGSAKGAFDLLVVNQDYVANQTAVYRTFLMEGTIEELEKFLNKDVSIVHMLIERFDLHHPNVTWELRGTIITRHQMRHMDLRGTWEVKENSVEAEHGFAWASMMKGFRSFKHFVHKQNLNFLCLEEPWVNCNGRQEYQVEQDALRNARSNERRKGPMSTEELRKVFKDIKYAILFHALGVRSTGDADNELTMAVLKAYKKKMLAEKSKPANIYIGEEEGRRALLPPSKRNRSKEKYLAIQGYFRKTVRIIKAMERGGVNV